MGKENPAGSLQNPSTSRVAAQITATDDITRITLHLVFVRKCVSLGRDTSLQVSRVASRKYLFEIIGMLRLP